MSSTERTRAGGATLELTRHERDVVFEMVRLQLEMPEPDSSMYAPDVERDGESYTERRERVATLLELYDCIGWYPDDPRERFPITVALDALVGVLEPFRDWLNPAPDDHPDDVASQLARQAVVAAVIDRVTSAQVAPAPGDPLCAGCGAPATHQGLDELLCDVCAWRWSQREHGQINAALTILPTVLGTLKLAGMTDDEILDVTRRELARGNELTCETPEPNVPDWCGPDLADDTRYRPLTGGEEQTR